MCGCLRIFKYCAMVDGHEAEARSVHLPPHSKEERPQTRGFRMIPTSPPASNSGRVSLSSRSTAMSPGRGRQPQREHSDVQRTVTKDRRGQGPAQPQRTVTKAYQAHRERANRTAKQQGMSNDLEAYIASMVGLSNSSLMDEDVRLDPDETTDSQLSTVQSLVNIAKSEKAPSRNLVLMPAKLKNAVVPHLLSSCMASKPVPLPVLWISDDILALEELLLQIAHLCPEESKLILGHAGVRAALKSASILLTTPHVLDLALKHDASLIRMIEARVRIVALDGAAAKTEVAARLAKSIGVDQDHQPAKRHFKPQRRTMFVFQSAQQISPAMGGSTEIVKTLRLEGAFCRSSADADLREFLHANQAHVELATIPPDAKRVVAQLVASMGELHNQIGAEVLAHTPCTQLSTSSLGLMVNDCSEKAVRAYESGDSSEVKKWAEIYKQLLQMYMFQTVLETIKNSSFTSALETMKLVWSKEGFKAAIPARVAESMISEFTSLTVTSRMTNLPAIQFPKFPAILKALRQEGSWYDQHASSVGLLDTAGTAFQALVLVVDVHTAKALISFLSSSDDALCVNEECALWPNLTKHGQVKWPSHVPTKNVTVAVRNEAGESQLVQFHFLLASHHLTCWRRRNPQCKCQRVGDPHHTVLTAASSPLSRPWKCSTSHSCDWPLMQTRSGTSASEQCFPNWRRQRTKMIPVLLTIWWLHSGKCRPQARPLQPSTIVSWLHSQAVRVQLRRCSPLMRELHQH